MERTPRRVTVAYDYNQLYLYDAALQFSAEGNEYLHALDAATRRPNRRSRGSPSGDQDGDESASGGG